MARTLAAVLALSLVTAYGAAEVSVEPRGARVDVVATKAPVADVLDRLARQTGMKVVYDGSPPRQPVSVTIRDHTPAEAVAEVLEGLGLNYALIADPTGAKVQTLMVLTRPMSGPSTASTPAPRPARASEPDSHRAYVPPVGVPPEEPVEDTPENPADPAAAGQGQVEPNNPQGQPAGQPPANAGPQQQPPAAVAPPQMFPVSPFAPQPPASAAPPATNPGTQQPPPPQQQQPQQQQP